MKGYFTVEAACVLPIVLGVYVFLIYGMFYQYDRCLLEQDVAQQVLNEQFDIDQYLAFQLEENVLRTENGKVTAWAEGTLTAPFKKMMEWAGDGGWRLKASFTSLDVRPTEWIRFSRKIMEGIEDVTDRIREKP